MAETPWAKVILSWPRFQRVLLEIMSDPLTAMAWEGAEISFHPMVEEGAEVFYFPKELVMVILPSGQSFGEAVTAMFAGVL